jgi:hypothetical protein
MDLVGGAMEGIMCSLLDYTSNHIITAVEQQSHKMKRVVW